MDKRNSNIELLRVIVAFMIILLHCLGVYGGVIKNLEKWSINFYIAIFLQSFSIIAVNCFVFITGYINLCSGNIEEKDYYAIDFVNALSNGKIFLEENPSERLTELENPYDATQRNSNYLQRGSDYIWDASYYKGKYYSYFGILPALILLVPFHLITGKYMIMSIAILIFSIRGIFI